ncbi:hypothetical protein TSUD_133650 [Trifolium subterraneum]|uniref:Uncharacterized protein n=1 Tax=Trifolium subterraneum TaxID=3900 RepID=A0A2Z6PRI5_TRISU|nr:hypothetical protein TSUD_133650 [Trifolium subterraneum]
MPLNIDLNTPVNELNTLPLNIDLNIPLNYMNTSNHLSNVPFNIDLNTSFNSSTNLYPPQEEEDNIGIQFESNLSQEEEEDDDDDDEEEEDIVGLFDNNIDHFGNMVTGFF